MRIVLHIRTDVQKLTIKLQATTSLINVLPNNGSATNIGIK